MAEQTFTVDGGMSPEALSAVMVDVGELIRASWREEAADHVDSGAYLAALEDRDALQYPYVGDPNAVGVVNLARHAGWLEYGRAGFHLAARMTRWKQGKNGPYARIAFRIFSPVSKGGGASTPRARGAMPTAVYAMAKKLEDGQRLRLDADAHRQAKSYGYYSQIFGPLPNTLAGSQGYEWKTGQYEGMFQSGSRRTPGGGTQSQYATIRTITPDSPGWYIPPTKALHLADRALAAAAPAIQQLLDQAAAVDLELRMTEAVRGLT